MYQITCPVLHRYNLCDGLSVRVFARWFSSVAVSVLNQCLWWPLYGRRGGRSLLCVGEVAWQSLSAQEVVPTEATCCLCKRWAAAAENPRGASGAPQLKWSSLMSDLFSVYRTHFEKLFNEL